MGFPPFTSVVLSSIESRSGGSSWLPRPMLTTTPLAVSKANNDDPPALKNGTGMPVNGMIASVANRFNNNCAITHVTMPTAMNEPKAVSAC